MRLIEARDGVALMCVPYDPKLVGNPATGVLHGGVITSVLDSASGAAVGSMLRGPRVAGEGSVAAGPWRPIATLDLRIDYMKPATPGRELMARAECYKVTRNVAFVRGVAYHDDPSDPIATTVATFMLATDVLTSTSSAPRDSGAEDGAASVGREPGQERGTS
jgi:uncharacterized protein (TIGR00369 family)